MVPVPRFGPEVRQGLRDLEFELGQFRGSLGTVQGVFMMCVGICGAWQNRELRADKSEDS